MQILDVAGFKKDIDVVLGGGRAHFQSSTRQDRMDLMELAKNKGYSVYSLSAILTSHFVPFFSLYSVTLSFLQNTQVVQDAEGLASVKSGKVLGLFSDYNMAYALDRNNNPSINATYEMKEKIRKEKNREEKRTEKSTHIDLLCSLF